MISEPESEPRSEPHPVLTLPHLYPLQHIFASSPARFAAFVGGIGKRKILYSRPRKANDLPVLCY